MNQQTMSIGVLNHSVPGQKQAPVELECDRKCHLCADYNECWQAPSGGLFVWLGATFLMALVGVSLVLVF